ncbi:hypothetical protein [Opitutus terrae]|uniref:Uncharacterized protein n=1 Tax=Opitutus terrae (strain DSM 11246 / JCM 15787 / PB90-1) TaxID=452637 RepID=B1ZWX1_OPITP|nr:hypothetical protein [Opitutus terrae]ACB75082.1 hypothetical protein Oter_1798 [Opitutus terrae PB90-1]
MAVTLRLRLLVWCAVPVCTLAVLFWVNSARVDRVRFVSALGLEPLRNDDTSATGYAGGMRQLIVPGQNLESYQWIEQTQQMLARGEWRVRRNELENAPEGRAVTASSPYRWWLRLVGWFDRQITGRAPGAAVEHAALWADPLLHGLIVAGLTGFVAWRFGLWSSAVVCLGLAFAFPLGANFVPGAPDDRGLALALALASVLPLAVGIAALRITAGAPSRAPHRWFVLAGLAGGLGLWVSVPVQAPLLFGCALGGLIALAVSPTSALVLPWRSWAVAGAATTLAAYLLEFAPDHLGSWQVRVVHPLHALAWLGLGELLTLASLWLQTRQSPRRLIDGLRLVGAVAAIGALVWVAQAKENGGLLAPDPSAFRLTPLVGDAAAPNFLRWLVQPATGVKPIVVMLPLLLAVPPAWWLLTRKLPATERTLILVPGGALVVALGLACWQLSWWAMTGALATVLAAVTIPTTLEQTPRRARWIWLAALLPAVIAGGAQFVSLADARRARSLDETELLGLVHRDLAHWLARRAGPDGAIVLAPPAETVALGYYGGLRGIGTLSWDNQSGLMATVRIVSATTRQEAEALIARREITHIVLPSWDSYFGEYARVGSGQVEGSFFDELQNLNLPPWLRPVAYTFPTIAGFEDRSVAVFEVVDEQDEATALGRMATYFVEAGRLELAAAAGQGLRRFPANLGAWVARAEVESARGDTQALEASLKYLLPRLKAGADAGLPLDRRIGLAVVLARAQHEELARAQVRRCLSQLDESRLRGLSTSAIYRLFALAKAYDLSIADARARQLGLELLPAELRPGVER